MGTVIQFGSVDLQSDVKSVTYTSKMFLHDIRSPIQTLNLIEQGKMDYRNDLQEIKDKCHQRINYLTALLQGETKSCSSYFCLAGVLNEVKKEKGIELGIKVKISCDKEIAWTSLDINKHELKNILSNLINNSFNSDASCTVRLKATVSTTGIKISIIDNARGIRIEDLGRLGHHGVSLSNTGQGLGLSTAINKVTNIGGKIICRSIPNAGTGITISLPVSRL